MFFVEQYDSRLTITPGDKFDAQANIGLDGPWPWI